MRQKTKSDTQNKLGITNWYELKDRELLKLEDSLLKRLVRQGTEKAGNVNQLAKTLNVSSSDFYKVSNDQSEFISVKKLRELIAYLGTDYHSLDDKITEIRKGKVASIIHPNFPFNLSTTTGASILGNIVSDGCIYIDKKARGVKRTKYSAATKEEEERFIQNINKLFGKVHFRKSQQRNSTYIRIGSSIVGDALSKAGAPVGRKATINSGMPTLVKEGSDEMQKAYLQAIFDDEGCVGGRKSFPFVTLTRYFHINDKLSEKEKNFLVSVEDKMNERTFPTGHLIKSIRILELKKLLNDNALLDLLSNKAPNLLEEESKLLKNFDIKNRIRNSRLNLTSNGRYSLASEMRIYRKKSLLKFYKDINFGLTSKKNKLKQSLINCNWL